MALGISLLIHPHCWATGRPSSWTDSAPWAAPTHPHALVIIWHLDLKGIILRGCLDCHPPRALAPSRVCDLPGDTWLLCTPSFPTLPLLCLAHIATQQGARGSLVLPTECQRAYSSFLLPSPQPSTAITVIPLADNLPLGPQEHRIGG